MHATELGNFKRLDNWSYRQDGSVHEYCPPLQVDNELQELIEYYNLYDAVGFHPILLGAWLHHRFVQIHPFRDGNGRVGRAILTWHLVKKEFFPIVVSDQHRDQYIDALEEADDDNLIPLIKLFVDLERDIILQALSNEVSEVQKASGLARVIENMPVRVNRRPSERVRRQVNHLASDLRANGLAFLDTNINGVKDGSKQNGLVEEGFKHQLRRKGFKITPRLKIIDSDQTIQNQYDEHVRAVTSSTNYRVSEDEPIYYIALEWNPYSATTPRLEFVTCLYNVGRGLTGVMAATAIYRLLPGASFIDSEQAADIAFRSCVVNQFSLTWKQTMDETVREYCEWLQQCLAVAVMDWQEKTEKPIEAQLEGFRD